MERYDYSILEICETLHMAKTGTADPLTEEESTKLRAFLVTRQLDWHPSHLSCVGYDGAVFALINAALKEWA